jgi:hypothetical protein
MIKETHRFAEAVPKSTKNMKFQRLKRLQPSFLASLWE